jgi:hypothetical protein
MSSDTSENLIKVSRIVLINTSLSFHKPPKYPPNEVKTSKYTVFSFLPRNLYEQFHGVANFYFLGVVILQWFPEFKTVDFAVPTLPIAIIIGVTAIKVCIAIFSNLNSNSTRMHLKIGGGIRLTLR